MISAYDHSNNIQHIRDVTAEQILTNSPLRELTESDPIDAALTTLATKVAKENAEAAGYAIPTIIIDFKKLDEALTAIRQEVERIEREALQSGRIASIDEYLAQCNILRVEPSRRSLMMFQAGQQEALKEIKAAAALRGLEGKDATKSS